MIFNFIREDFWNLEKMELNCEVSFFSIISDTTRYE